MLTPPNCYRCDCQPCECKDGITLYHADCREVLPELEPVDLVLTDPPYGIPEGACFWRKHGTSLEEWRDARQNAAVENWLEHCPIADHGYVLEFMHCHPKSIEATCCRHRLCGLTPWHIVMIAKLSPPPTPRPTFASGYEAALVSHQGERKWHGSGYVVNRWIGQTPNARKAATHPTEKPIEPLKQWLEGLALQNALVLDPFLGSGTTLRACKDLGRRGIGIEIEEKYCEIAARRLEQEVLF